MGNLGSKQPVTARILHSRPQDHLYRPHDVIQGVVELRTTRPVVIPHVFVHLKCETNVHLRIEHKHRRSAGPYGGTDITYTYEHFRLDAVLFDEGQLLSSQRGILHPGELRRIDFTFRVPERTNRPCPQGFEENQFSHVWPRQEHNLPPSCSPGRPAKKKLDSFGVYYSLEVTLRPEHNVALNKAWRTPIQFCPLRPYTELTNPQRIVSTRSFRIQTSLLSDPGTELHLHQRLRDSLSTTTPRANFSVTVELPRRITAGSQFKFRAAISVLSRSDPGLRLSRISFLVRNISLRTTYHARAPRDWYAKTNWKGRPGRHMSYSSWIYPRHSRLGELSRVCPDPGPGLLLHAVSDSLAARLPVVPGVETQGNECEVWFTGWVPVNAGPSFRSFALSRDHTMEVHMIVKIWHKEYKMVASGRCSIEAASG